MVWLSRQNRHLTVVRAQQVFPAGGDKTSGCPKGMCSRELGTFVLVVADES